MALNVINLNNCFDRNSNARGVSKAIRLVHEKYPNSYWYLSDVCLDSILHEEYYGNGGARSVEIAYNFMSKMEVEHVAIMNFDELMQVLDDTRQIDSIILICFPQEVSVPWDINQSWIPAENEEPGKLEHPDCICQFRVFNGGSIAEFISNDAELYDLITQN